MDELDESPEMYKVDSKTLLDIGRAIDELAGFDNWLIVERADSEAFGKLHPIVMRLVDLMGAIIEGNDPAFGAVLDANNRAWDETQKALAQARTKEEREQILQEFNEFVRQVREIGEAAVAKAEAGAEKKERKH